MSESTMTVDEWGVKYWKNSKGQFHRTGGPAIEWANGDKEWFVNGEFLGEGDEGFWALWEILTDEQKKDPTLLSYLPGNLNV